MANNWDTDSMNRAIFSRLRQLENRNNEILKYKFKKSPFYKKEYDENLGALQVNIQFENSISLESRVSFLDKLKELKHEKPFEECTMFDYESVKRGWRQEIRLKIGRYEK
jgi:hypothetical protein